MKSCATNRYARRELSRIGEYFGLYANGLFGNEFNTVACALRFNNDLNSERKWWLGGGESAAIDERRF